jgi:hypothetical protein
MKKLNLNIFKVQLKKNCRKIDLLRIILYQIRMKKFWKILKKRLKMLKKKELSIFKLMKNEIKYNVLK